MINIAILGFGVIGSGCAEVLTQNKAVIEKRINQEINIKYILDLRDFPQSKFGHLIIHDFNTILNDDDVSIVVEMMGGLHPAYDFSIAAIKAGKSVVTSNKEVVAKYGSELLHAANTNNVRYLFEASVGGGIPIIRPMINDLAPNNVISIDGILNGTTNYILTQMTSNGTSFEAALADAQSKGYAEANPTADIEGHDTARKIAILSAIAFSKMIDISNIHVEGITKITSDDIAIGDKIGCAIKLVAHAELLDGKICAYVSPSFVNRGNPLYSINDVYNGILIDTDMLGQVMFYGQGAGSLPTASSVVADIIDIIIHMDTPASNIVWDSAEESSISSFYSCECSYCLSFFGCISDMSEISAVFGNVKVYFENGILYTIIPKMVEKDIVSAISKCKLQFRSRIKIF